MAPSLTRPSDSAGDSTDRAVIRYLDSEDKTVKADELREAIQKSLRDGTLQIVDGEIVEAPRFTSFKNHVQRLKKCPLFNLSLASKELFHSNFLAWLCEAYPNQVGRLFARFTKIPCASCRRWSE